MMKVRHMHRISGRWYWIPSASARKLGFRSDPLGDDIHKGRLRAEELNAQLDAERSKSTPARVAQGTVSALIKRYRTSPAFLDLAPKTRVDYGNILARIEDRAGQVAVDGIDRAGIVRTYESLREKHGESMAAAMMRIWRILLGHAYDIGWRNDNPAKGLRLRTQKPRTAVWTPEDVDRYCAAAIEEGRPSIALAVRLAYDIGQRQADVLKLMWSQYDGRGFSIQQNKTGQKVYAAVTPPMAAELDAMARNGVQVIVSEATSKPYRLDHFRHEFSRIRAASGIGAGLQFRDLRRTAATELGEAGATDDELRAQGGWKSRNVVAVYVKPTAGMSRAAQAKRTAKRDGGG